ncbi:hypothetical protein LTR62_005775 [Meristemomyces frigidus]|uniref:Uncharacterized protein n=1 Tax=Meristemomyces frigidus TaxID=1508187 RepID=A0AAN7YEX4_9PEZI|nr:hypothetical protein LTR62_005775 [Meristemomyces frigidus]
MAWILLLSVIALVLSWAAYSLFCSPLSAFRGPPLAGLTDVVRSVATARGKIDSVHRKWHKKYGTAVRIGPNTISISDPSLIKTIYATKNAWQKSPMYRPNDVLVGHQRLSNLFNTQDNAWHDKAIKPIRTFWSMSKVLDIEPYIDETLKFLVSKLDQKFVQLGKTCMMDEWLGFFAWDVTANLTFGRHYGFIEQEQDVDNLIVDSTNGLRYFAPISQIPWLDNFLDKNPIHRIGPKPTLTGVMYAFGVVASYQQDLKTSAKPAGSVDHYLDKYISLRETQSEVTVDDNQLVNWLMLNILAGGDTTSAAMRAVVYYLAKNPKNYNKLVAELDSARLPLPAQWKAIYPLTYLDAVIREAIRYCPGIAMVLERVVPTTGLQLPDGRIVPAGTNVGINPGVTSRDPAIFGSDADVFDADRWLRRSGEDEAQFEARFNSMTNVSEFAFGAGSRGCIGKQLARLETYKLIATLYSQYDFRSNWVVDPATGEYSSNVRSPTGIASDPALASYGVQQAEQLGQHLSKVNPPVDLVYSSPFYRCLQTLAPFTNSEASRKAKANDGKVRVIVEPGIGEFYGLARFDHPSPASLDVLNTHFPHLHATPDGPHIVPSMKGESIPQLHDRLAYCMDRIIRAADADPAGPKALLICSHAAAMIAIGRALTGRMPEDEGEQDFKCFTCSFSRFERRSETSTGEVNQGQHAKWNPANADQVPDIGWRDRGVAGGWDCKVNGDCSFLDNGEERGWHFSGDEAFLADPNAFNDANNTKNAKTVEVTSPSTASGSSGVGMKERDMHSRGGKL